MEGVAARHTVAMVVTSPLLFLAYTALGSGVDGVESSHRCHVPCAALILAAYLPIRGAAGGGVLVQ